MTDDLTSVDALREIYKEPPPVSMMKLDALDEHCITWVAHTPLIFLATSAEDGSCDCSPKGGPPGFVKVLDAKHLAIGDLSGNNKIDNFRNLVTRNGIGMVFVIPGVIEVMRVNGRARITTDPTINELASIDGVVPKVTLVVEVDEAYVHCGKALRRAGVWAPERWPDLSAMPTYGRIMKDHKNLSAEADVLDQTLVEAYSDEWLWRSGGDEEQHGAFEPISFDTDIQRPLADVLAFLSDHQNESQWFPLISSSQLASGAVGEPGAQFTGIFELMGNEVPLIVDLTEHSDVHVAYELEMASEILHERYVLAEGEHGTHLTMSFDAGEMTKIMAPLVTPPIEEGLVALKVLLETGGTH